MSCGVGCRCGLDPLLLWLWRRPVAIALTRPQAWEPLYAAGAAQERTKRHMYLNVIAALFTTAKTWKQPTCPWTDEWRKKLWPMYTMEYYLAKKNEILLFATWMDIMPNEISQKEKDMISFLCEI